MQRRGYLLLVLAVVFFWRLWFMPDGFLYPAHGAYSDLTITHWPNALFIRRSLATWRQLPLWRPLILGGEPFAANPLSGLWYPPNLLLLALPLNLAFNLLFVLHTAWAGWGGYRLARAVGASPAGGLLAAFTLMFAPRAIAHLVTGHVGLYCAFAWLPWALRAVRRLARKGDPSNVAAVAVTVALMVLADVRMGFYGGLMAAGYWLWNILAGRGDRGQKRPVRVGAALAAALLTAALLAVQVLPLAAVSGRLNRGRLGLEESAIGSLPPRYLIGTLVADHGGYHEWMTYLGAVSLLFALVGLARWPGRERWWWGSVGLVAALYSLGTNTPLYGLLYRCFSPLGWLRVPARAWFLAVVATAVLAARGMTARGEAGLAPGARPLLRRRAGLAAVALVGATLAGGLGAWILGLPVNVVATAAVWPAGGALLALRAARRLRAPAFACLVLGLGLADLWLVDFTLFRVRSADEVMAEGRAAAAWLSVQPRPFRVYSPSYSIPQHTGAAYDIETVDGVDPFQLSDYVAFMRVATGVDVPGYSVTLPPFPEVAEGEDALLAHREAVPDLRLLGLLNVRYLAAAYPMKLEGLAPLAEQEGVHLYQNEYALPRAFVIGRVEVSEGTEEALAWLMENDPGQAATVERGTPLDGPPGVKGAHLIEWTPNRIQVEAEGPGLLVLSEVYEPDWRVRVDGRPEEVVRVNGILRGVYLGKDRHRVEFAYRPGGLETGLVMAIAGWAAVVALYVMGRRQPQEIPPVQGPISRCSVPHARCDRGGRLRC